MKNDIDILKVSMISFIIPDQLGIQLVGLYWHNHLVVLTSHYVSVGQHPSTASLGLVVLEVSFEVGAVGVGPFARKESIFHPLSDIFHSRCIEDVSAMSVLLAVEPVPRKDVLVGVDIHPFTFLSAFHPLAIVLALISIDETTDSMLKIVLEISSVDVAVGVGVFSLAVSQLNGTSHTPFSYSPS